MNQYRGNDRETDQQNLIYKSELINDYTYKISTNRKNYSPFIENSSDSIFKYNEDVILKEIEEYIASTYKKHYAGDNGVQSVDLIESAGHIEGFYLGNIIKYAGRYGRKNGKNRADILKIIHYAILSLYIHDKYNMKDNSDDR